MTIEDKVDEMAKLWVRWNIKKISDGEFIFGVGRIFKDEISNEWDNHMRRIKKYQASGFIV